MHPFQKQVVWETSLALFPKSLVKAGHEVAVILPYYDMVEAKFGNQIEDVLHFEVSVGWRRQYCGIKKTVLNGVTFYFIDSQYYFFRGHVYGDFDDGNVSLSSNWLPLRLWKGLTSFLTFSMFMTTIQP